MTTLENRPNTALLVVDVQNGVVEGAPERDAVVANVGSLVEKARQEQVPVVWVQHSDEDLARGSDDWQIVPELDSGRRRAARREELRRLLRGHRLSRRCCRASASGDSSSSAHRPMRASARRSTARSARGYDATLVSDAHTTEDQTPWGAPPPDQVIAHTNLYWKYQTAPGRTAGTVETKEVDFGTS